MTRTGIRSPMPIEASAGGLAIGALLAAALVAALVDLAGIAAATTSKAPRDALPAAPGTAGKLFAHNARVVLWPLALIALGWQRHRLTRWVADGLIAAQLLVHGALIGSALAQHPGLWRYVPHLPVEWLALALPAAAWITARRHPAAVNRGGLIGLTAVVLVLLASAAIVETYLVPL